MSSSITFSWPWLLALVLGSTVLSTVIAQVLDRNTTHAELVRTGYADAIKALNAWGQFPFRVRRRANDEIATLIQLEELGAGIQESLAYSTGWISAHNELLGSLYEQLLTCLRAEVTVHAQLAWASRPASRARSMNLTARVTADESNGQVPAEWTVVRLFAESIKYRSGWRRYLLPPAVARRQLNVAGLVAEAKTALAERSARLLTER